MERYEEKNILHFDIPAFQGPLDLLLQLIQQEKIDIYDIPVARITDQFIAALRQMESLDMEVTTEFLVMAAQLLYLKSRFLLPQNVAEEEAGQEEEDPRQELVERLLAYKAFKEAALYLQTRDTSSGRSYGRDIDLEALLAQMPVPDPLQGVAFQDLWQAFVGVIRRAEKGEEINYIQPEDVSLEAVIKHVWCRVILQPKGIRFQQLIRFDSRREALLVFLAILELLKSGKVKAEQASAQADIFIFPTAKAWDFSKNTEE
jgi:segregation and condensation protein A